MENSPVLRPDYDVGLPDLSSAVDMGGLMMQERDGRLEVALSQTTSKRLKAAWRVLPWLTAFVGLIVAVILLNTHEGSPDGVAHPGLLATGYVLTAAALLVVSRSKQIAIDRSSAEPLVLDRGANTARIGDRPLGPLSGIARVVAVVDRDARANSASIAIEMRGGDRYVIAPRPLAYNAVYSTAAAERIANFIGKPLETQDQDFSTA